MSNFINAQSFDPSVISGGGNSMTSGGVILTSTISETITGNITNNEIIFVQGFQQNREEIPLIAGSISGEKEVCKGTTNVTYSVPLIAYATSYIWTLPSGALGVSKSNNITLNFGDTSQSGILSVKGQNNSGTGIESSMNITVNPIPETPEISISAGLLQSNSFEGNQWYFNNTPIENAKNSTFQAIEYGDYYVIVSLNNCYSERSNEIAFPVAGVSGFIESNLISVFPNPSKESVNVRFENPTTEEYLLELLDVSGKTLQNQTLETGTKETHMDVSVLPEAAYFVKISRKKGTQTETYKIQKIN